jgi:hypothetical protein
MNLIYDFTYALAKARQADLIKEAERDRLAAQARRTAKHEHARHTNGVRLVPVKRPSPCRQEPVYR